MQHGHGIWRLDLDHNLATCNVQTQSPAVVLAFTHAHAHVHMHAHGRYTVFPRRPIAYVGQARQSLGSLARPAGWQTSVLLHLLHQLPCIRRNIPMLTNTMAKRCCAWDVGEDWLHQT